MTHMTIDGFLRNAKLPLRSRPGWVLVRSRSDCTQRIPRRDEEGHRLFFMACVKGFGSHVFRFRRRSISDATIVSVEDDAGELLGLLGLTDIVASLVGPRSVLAPDLLMSRVTRGIIETVLSQIESKEVVEPSAGVDPFDIEELHNYRRHTEAGLIRELKAHSYLVRDADDTRYRITCSLLVLARGGVSVTDAAFARAASGYSTPGYARHSRIWPSILKYEVAARLWFGGYRLEVLQVVRLYLIFAMRYGTWTR